jgi:hypothetical protein
MRQHLCPAVVGEELGYAVAAVRGLRLIIAAMRDEDDASKTILDKLEGCALCMRFMVGLFATMMKTNWIEGQRGNKTLALAKAEAQLTRYVEKARQLM